MFQIQYIDRHPAPVTEEEHQFLKSALLEAKERHESEVPTIPLNGTESLPKLKKKILWVANDLGFNLRLVKKDQNLILKFLDKSQKKTPVVTNEEAESRVCQLFSREPGSCFSRAQIAREIQVPPKRVGRILYEFELKGLVTKEGRGPKTAFRWTQA